jgi:predicted nucleotidyltransferase
VEEAARAFARAEAERRPELLRLGYFGSYARGDAGVGSDLDLVAVVESSGLPFERRAVQWDLTRLPVPAEVLVYTAQEWAAMEARGDRFARVLREESVRLFDRRRDSPGG